MPQYCTHHLDYMLRIECLLCKKFRSADLNSYVTSHRRRITHIYISSYALQPQAFAYFLPTASILCLPLRRYAQIIIIGAFVSFTGEVSTSTAKVPGGRPGRNSTQKAQKRKTAGEGAPPVKKSRK